MISITNNKIAALQAKWASFPGFSLLFDNPGYPLFENGDCLYLKNSVNDHENRAFLDAIALGVERIGVADLFIEYNAAALNFDSYHVTALDGGNIDNIGRLPESIASHLHTTLDNLPDSLSVVDPIVETMANSPLCQERDWGIRFKFKNLYSWSAFCLVCVLEAANEDSHNRLENFMTERIALSDQLYQRFGIKRNSGSFSPHVTLAYFMNKERASLIEQSLPKWNGIISETLADKTICFATVSLYGFTDMQTFFTKKSLFRGDRT